MMSKCPGQVQFRGNLSNVLPYTRTHFNRIKSTGNSPPSFVEIALELASFFAASVAEGALILERAKHNRLIKLNVSLDSKISIKYSRRTSGIGRTRCRLGDIKCVRLGQDRIQSSRAFDQVDPKSTPSRPSPLWRITAGLANCPIDHAAEKLGSKIRFFLQRERDR